MPILHYHRSSLIVGLSCAVLAIVTARAEPDESRPDANPTQSFQIAPAQIVVKVEVDAGPVSQLAAHELRSHLSKLAVPQDPTKSKDLIAQPYVIYEC